MCAGKSSALCLIRSGCQPHENSWACVCVHPHAYQECVFTHSETGNGKQPLLGFGVLPLTVLGLSSLPRRKGKVILDGVDNRRENKWYCFVYDFMVMACFLRKVYLALKAIIWMQNAILVAMS